ncbi:hypothetical protein [Streptomyces boluensis]|uniref:Uncharacterized protein n=1 Tax=Streptomyces boluensis TaxID=1775135 RepID=A0A964UN13_9ACTN|nr:hypothetical protein [Streptomyces boluensis]NBE52144.1 hypothetical protein [Streptomyces boluensis]
MEPIDIIRTLRREEDGDSPQELLAELGNVPDAVAYASLFWPDVISLHGSVILDIHGYGAAEVESRLERTMERHGPGRSVSEWRDWVYSFNYFEAAYIFREFVDFGEREHEAYLAFAHILVPPWQARLDSMTSIATRPRVYVTEQIEGVGICVAVSQQINPENCPPGW